MGIEAFERRVETIVESMFARASRRGVEPVEIGRRLVRDAERNKKAVRSGEILPNQFNVHLSPTDFGELEPIESAIRHELTELIKETASDNQYRFVGKVSVEFVEDRSQRPGAMYVESSFLEDDSMRARAYLVLPGGKRVTLGHEVFQIGRSPSSSLVIEDARVSRNHAVIAFQDGVGSIRDLGSTNGTFVNGERVNRELILRSGDDIKIGASEMTYLIE